MKIKINPSYKLKLSVVLSMANQAQNTQNNKFAKSSNYINNDQWSWLIYVMGIISFICQSKTATNDYLHLKNKSRDQSPVIIFFCRVLFKKITQCLCAQILIEIFYTFTDKKEREEQLEDAKEKLINFLVGSQQK